jgi:tetratricopeptide (TPR) repeat protein
MVGTANVDVESVSSFLSNDRMAYAAAAEAILTKVLSLAPDHALAQYLLARVYIHAAEGIVKCEHALGLDRNLAATHAIIGVAKFFTGRAEETENHVLEALRFSPRDTEAYAWMMVAGAAKLYLGRDEEAAAWLRRSVETNPNFSIPHFLLATALAHLGQMSHARAATQAGLALDPAFTINRYRAGASTDNPTYLAQRERIYEGMQKAGVPEG